jgi:hypothetical protein
MTGTAFRLYFHGYYLWRQEQSPEIDILPSGPLIYCLYACNRSGFRYEAVPRKLLRIGQCEKDLRRRLSQYEAADFGREYLRQGEERCYTWARCREHHSLSRCLSRIENALIFKHRPPGNKNLRYCFGVYTGDTTITTDGASFGLESSFTLPAKT